MVNCPFCGFTNEEGALFCEQCKSDLASVPTAYAEAAPPPVAEVVESASPESAIAEAAPMAAIVEEEIPPAESATGQVDVVAEAEAVPIKDEQEASTMTPAPAVEQPAEKPAAAAEQVTLAPDAKPRLVVIRGQKVNEEFQIYEGHNFIGRSDEQPVDIDLEHQEHPDRVYISRQHALITFENGALTLEDLNSSNGTYLNRAKVHPGQPQPLKPNDVIQIGSVQMRVTV